MKQALVVIFASLVVSPAEARSLRAHSNKPECGSLVKCTLHDSVTGSEIALNAGGDSTTYNPAGRYTVQCETSGTVNKMTYTYVDENNELHKDTTWNSPFTTDEVLTMHGRSGALAVQIVGEIWTGECFAEEFTLISETPSSNNADSSFSLCNFSCPIYSQPKEGVSCVSSLDSCDCDYSYKLVGDYCVKDWCYHDFQCPSNKERIPGIDCYSSVSDCRYPRSSASSIS